MPHIATVYDVGGMLCIPVPRRLVRELGLVKRQHVVIERGRDRALVVVPVEDYLRERRRLSARPAR